MAAQRFHEEQLIAAREALRDAVFHLASCWDSLSVIESELGCTIETDAIQCLAGEIGEPAQAYRRKHLPIESLDEVLNALEVD